MKAKITQERLKELLHYCPETGVFTRARNRRGGAKKGDIAGTLNNGYIQICVDCRIYMAHRLAVLYMTGEFPPHDTDHINMNKADNRWVNLRCVTKSQNQHNRVTQRNNTSGFKGVKFVANRWCVGVHFNGRRVHGGRFPTLEAAIKAEKTLRETLHGEFANHG